MSLWEQVWSSTGVRFEGGHRTVPRHLNPWACTLLKPLAGLVLLCVPKWNALWGREQGAHPKIAWVRVAVTDRPAAVLLSVIIVVLF